MPKPKKVGRPKMAKGEAKAKVVPVRFDVDDLKLVTAAANANKQTLSEWIRNALRTAAEVSMFENTLHDAMRSILLEQPEQQATTSQVSEEIAKRGLYSKRNGESAKASQVNARARKYPHLFTFADPHTIQLTSNS